VALGLLGLPWADGDGMTRLPPQPPASLDRAAASILEPEVPAGGIGFQSPQALHVQVAVDLAAVTDCRDGNLAGAVVYCVNDPVVTYPRSQPLAVTLERLYVRGARLCGQSVDGICDRPTDGGVKLSE
jgi:hypothetical protein